MSKVQNPTPADVAAIELLQSIGQQHILDALPAAGTDDDKKRALFEQVHKLNSDYPGGLAAYVNNAKSLLLSSLRGDNPYEGFEPTVPNGARLAAATPEFDSAETVGMAEMHRVAFVIVAGGLGERLGYSGIKLELPSELTTSWCFLELYAKSILALQDRARKLSGDNKVVVPLCIMTSGDTHEKTVELLEANDYFGLRHQLTIVKQEKVPALTDNDAHFAMEDTFTISTKPHGHGDVHTLLHSKGVVKAWTDAGKKWICFIQDTNGLVFHAIPAAVGVSKTNNFVVNSLAVPRRPGEAVGGICCLKHSDGRAITLNVEYNQLDPLLRGTGKGGDTADETGFSPFPGNINVLVFELSSYSATLQRTNGSIPEFVNPKYSDSTKTTFKKPTRLECMMQDYPKLLSPEEKVGFTQVDRWISFSAVKNNIVDAADKLKQTGFAESASSGEADLYFVNRKILASAGVDVAESAGSEEYGGVQTSVGAHVVLTPSFATTVGEAKARFISPKSVHISNTSTLLLEGDIVVDSLELDGTLVVRAAPGAHVTIRGLKVKNNGWQFEPLDPADNSVPESLKIRGYKLNKQETEERVFSQPGDHECA